MHITRVRLKNWKNLANVDVELFPRTFLVGVNGAGTSNFLDALRFVRDVAAHGVARAVLLRGGWTKVHSLFARKGSEVALGLSLKGEGQVWEYDLQLAEGGQFPVLVGRECVRKNGALLLDRPDEADLLDTERRTQTALEQVCANRPFRELANFVRSIGSSHLLPQAVRDPEGFTPPGQIFREPDPFGRDLVRRIWATPQPEREERMGRLVRVLRLAVPTLSRLWLGLDRQGRPHLQAHFAGHSQRSVPKRSVPQRSVQDERSLSDGTLRLIALLWVLQEGGPLLLEEPESTLPEDIVRCLPAFFARRAAGGTGEPGGQVIVSTHSWALLSDPGIQPEEVLEVLPGQAGSTVQPVSRDARTLMAASLSAAEAVLPEIWPEGGGNLASLSL